MISIRDRIDARYREVGEGPAVFVSVLARSVERGFAAYFSFSKMGGWILRWLKPSAYLHRCSAEVRKKQPQILRLRSPRRPTLRMTSLRERGFAAHFSFSKTGGEILRGLKPAAPSVAAPLK